MVGQRKGIRNPNHMEKDNSKHAKEWVEEITPRNALNQAKPHHPECDRSTKKRQNREEEKAKTAELERDPSKNEMHQGRDNQEYAEPPDQIEGKLIPEYAPAIGCPCSARVELVSER